MWHRKDEEKLLEAINGGNSLYFASSVSLGGKFDVPMCEKKLIDMENKVWNVDDEQKVWKLQSLFDTHASQVSVQLRRPISCIRRHLTEMKQRRFKPLNSIIEEYKRPMLNDEEEKRNMEFKKFMSNEDDLYKKFYQDVFTDYVDPIAYEDFITKGEIEFRTILFIPGMDDGYKSKLKSIIFSVKRVLTFDYDLLPTYLSFVKAVVDSDGPLNVSGETLKGSRVESIVRNRLTGKVFDLLDEISEREEKRVGTRLPVLSF
ncbi:hypothetical protein CARUB_v10017766mg [Capsella rubella]|uniref:Uncharacterized protein n=1 Tax=Capsella rubella TaxID=81985 RepID=R0HH72_9BRAS|nr:hypothetical protein CARUB_v10017766mg [Capsella rubella]